MLAVLLMMAALVDPDPAAQTTAPAVSPATSPSTSPAPAAANLPWRIAATREFALALPLKWTPKPLNSPAAMLYLVRENLVDEYNQKMDAALTVERFPARRQTLDEGIKGMIDKARNDARWQLSAEPTTEPVKLADGTDATLLILEMQGKAAGRRATQVKLMTVDKNDVGWVVGAHVVASHNSKLPERNGDIIKRLRAHLLSFSLTPDKVDDTPLRAAYGANSGKAPTASPTTAPSTVPSTAPLGD